MTKAESPVDRIVRQIDDETRTTLFRNQDGPDRTFVPLRQRQDPAVRRAKARQRTAAWRNELDRMGRPEARDIAMALAAALAMSPNLDNAMTHAELRFVGVALADLEARGFDREQVKNVLRRLRKRLVESRHREESEPTGPTIASEVP